MCAVSSLVGVEAGGVPRIGYAARAMIDLYRDAPDVVKRLDREKVVPVDRAPAWREACSIRGHEKEP